MGLALAVKPETEVVEEVEDQSSQGDILDFTKMDACMPCTACRNCICAGHGILWQRDRHKGVVEGCTPIGPDSKPATYCNFMSREVDPSTLLCMKAAPGETVRVKLPDGTIKAFGRSEVRERRPVKVVCRR